MSCISLSKDITCFITDTSKYSTQCGVSPEGRLSNSYVWGHQSVISELLNIALPRSLSQRQSLAADWKVEQRGTRDTYKGRLQRLSNFRSVQCPCTGASTDRMWRGSVHRCSGQSALTTEQPIRPCICVWTNHTPASTAVAANRRSLRSNQSEHASACGPITHRHDVSRSRTWQSALDTAWPMGALSLWRVMSHGNE